MVHANPVLLHQSYRERGSMSFALLRVSGEWGGKQERKFERPSKKRTSSSLSASFRSSLELSLARDSRRAVNPYARFPFGDQPKKSIRSSRANFRPLFASHQTARNSFTHPVSPRVDRASVQDTPASPQAVAARSYAATVLWEENYTRFSFDWLC